MDDAVCSLVQRERGKQGKKQNTRIIKLGSGRESDGYEDDERAERAFSHDTAQAEHTVGRLLRSTS